MGLFDKAKKLLEKSAQMLENLPATTPEKQQELTPEEKQRQEELMWEEEERLEQEEREAEEAEKNARVSKRKAEILEKVLTPSCEKGDCTWYKGEFFFTCPADCECHRKQNTKSKWGKSKFDPKYWPYMKRWDLTYADSYEMQDDLCEDFVREFMPNYWVYPVEQIISYGLCENNGLLKLIPVLNSLPKTKGMYSMNEKLDFLLSKYLWSEPMMYTWNNELEKHPFLLNPSLYTRNQADFEYAVKLYDAIASGSVPYAYFPQGTEEDKDNLYAALFDANGNLKPSGTGDTDEDRYGDTLVNAVENWEAEMREKYKN